MHKAAIKPERRLPALAISHGIGIGRVVFLHGENQRFFRIDLDPSQVETELERFRSAVDECSRQLRSLSTPEHADPNQPVSGIFGVHLLIIEESSLIAKIESAIRDRQVNSEWALKIVSDQYIERQEKVADPSFREKFLDIEDVSRRILTVLNGSPSKAQLTYSGAVVVARELRPSTILDLKKNLPAALITERGGWTSHASILAREFGIPMVSGLRSVDHKLSHGDHVIVDAVNGEIIVDPSLETVQRLRSIADNSDQGYELPPVPVGPTATTNGTNITIRANVDIPEAYDLAQLFGGEGIGLFRSESLIANPGNIPSEESQCTAYRQIAEIAGDAGVKIRTFDIGIDQLGDGGFSTERNPSLGLRSIRLSLTDTAHFRTQIRAILRAAHEKRVDIILPMISGVEEVIRSRAIIDEERERLSRERSYFGNVGIGAMIEVPSAVLTIEEIAANVDFVCLGTNDLVQYLLAVDRDNDAVADWYQTLHPAVIRALSDVFAAAAYSNIPVIVCGEMAGSSFYIPLLIGLGARELSMNPNSIPQARRVVSGISLRETKKLAANVRGCTTAEAAERILREYYLENWAHLFQPGLLAAKHR